MVAEVSANKTITSVYNESRKERLKQSHTSRDEEGADTAHNILVHGAFKLLDPQGAGDETIVTAAMCSATSR